VLKGTQVFFQEAVGAGCSLNDTEPGVVAELAGQQPRQPGTTSLPLAKDQSRLGGCWGSLTDQVPLQGWAKATSRCPPAGRGQDQTQ